MVRTVAALVAAAFVAAVAALIVGEYGVAGWVTLMVGTVTGLVTGEIAASVARSRSWVVGLASGALAGAGVLWGAYLDSGRGIAPLGWEAAAAPALAFAVTVFSVRTYKLAQANGSEANAAEAIEGEGPSERLGDN